MSGRSLRSKTKKVSASTVPKALSCTDTMPVTPVNPDKKHIQPSAPKGLARNSSSASTLGSRKRALAGDESGDESDVPFQKQLFQSKDVEVVISPFKGTKICPNKKRANKEAVSLDSEDDPFSMEKKPRQTRKKPKVVLVDSSDEESNTLPIENKVEEMAAEEQEIEEKGDKEEDIEEEETHYTVENPLEDEDKFIPEDCAVTDVNLMDRLLKTSYKSLPSLDHSVSLTGGSINVQTLGASLLTEKEYGNLHLDYLVQIMTFSQNASLDLINPARVDPNLFETNKATHRGIIFKENGQVALFVTIGFVVKSDLMEGRMMNTGKGKRYIREFYVSPLSMEWERGLAFYGSVFGKRKLSIFCMEGGIPFGTMVGERESTASSSKAETPKSTKSTASSASSSLSKGGKYSFPTPTSGGNQTDASSGIGIKDMTKHPLGLLDTIPVWNCTRFYKRLGEGGTTIKGDPRFLFTKAHKLAKHIKGDLELGDLVVVIHTVTEYVKSGYSNLNLNVQGIYLLARKQ